MTEKYLCIHGHFYQPPRENPWIEAIERQASAEPYHDWNERITRECYGPNTRARVHGREGRILRLINNYEYMSFNFGPTLLSWLEDAHPWIYSQILSADKAGQVRYQGHGNALAQVYNHIIMPLARTRDKLTQIRWGLADFRQRFGRPAEGMWLAETAVDTETLNLMAGEGVKFTILSPTQAQSIRPLTGRPAESSWKDVSGERIDPGRPYRVILDGSGRHFIDIFFYDGPLSRAVAYEKLLTSGEDLLARIEHSFGLQKKGPRLVSIATDGESYGHHFKFGDLALSWLFQKTDRNDLIKMTNYGSFLEHYPPSHEVRIIENSSWSCSHGVNRWRADCGCNVSHTKGWNQAWREPLRNGLDWLAEELSAIFEERAGRLLKDPWEARDDYITVLIQPSKNRRELFLKQHAVHPLGTEEKIEAFQLMESQRMALYMFTSCGWFFDDISGLEAAQVLKYAARAIDMTRPWALRDLESGLISFLAGARSNEPVYGDGKRVYQTLVKPSRIDASLAAAHYAFSTLVNGLLWDSWLFPGIVRPVQERRLSDNGLNAVLGETKITEKGTGREFERIYLALRREDRALSCYIGENLSAFDMERAAGEISSILNQESCERTEDVLGKYLEALKRYELRDLIPDMRRWLIRGMAGDLDHRIKDSMGHYNGDLKRIIFFLKETGEPAPEMLGGILGLVMAERLSRLMTSEETESAVDWAYLHDLAAQTMSMTIDMNEQYLRQVAHDFLGIQMKKLALSPDQVYLRNVTNLLDLTEKLRILPDLWECQNMFYDLYSDQDFTQTLDPDLFSTFNELGRKLGFIVEGE